MSHLVKLDRRTAFGEFESDKDHLQQQRHKDDGHESSRVASTSSLNENAAVLRAINDHKMKRLKVVEDNKQYLVHRNITRITSKMEPTDEQPPSQEALIHVPGPREILTKPLESPRTGQRTRARNKKIEADALKIRQLEEMLHNRGVWNKIKQGRRTIAAELTISETNQWLNRVMKFMFWFLLALAFVASSSKVLDNTPAYGSLLANPSHFEESLLDISCRQSYSNTAFAVQQNQDRKDALHLTGSISQRLHQLITDTRETRNTNLSESFTTLEKLCETKRTPMRDPIIRGIFAQECQQALKSIKHACTRATYLSKAATLGLQRIKQRLDSTRSEVLISSAISHFLDLQRTSVTEQLPFMNLWSILAQTGQARHVLNSVEKAVNHTNAMLVLAFGSHVLSANEQVAYAAETGIKSRYLSSMYRVYDAKLQQDKRYRGKVRKDIGPDAIGVEMLQSYAKQLINTTADLMCIEQDLALYTGMVRRAGTSAAAIEAIIKESGISNDEIEELKPVIDNGMKHLEA